jgi:uncharacterized protein (TIGR00255 family)
MLSSMTGFGKGEGRINDMDVVIEVKSVNSRYLEIFVALPKFLTFLEEPVRKHIREHLQRGNIHCYINVIGGNSIPASYKVNTSLLKSFIATVREIAEVTQIEPQVSMQDLLTQPELLSLEENTIDRDELEKQLLIILDKALSELHEMEVKEGDYISRIFLDRLQSIEDQIGTITHLQKENVQKHINTMRARITGLLNDELNEASFHQEVLQMADKLDISEEIDRFNSHIHQFSTYLKSQTPVGKRLNFLLQEMNREVTTMGNKASDSKISQFVVEIKNELETIREQVQNIQ